MPRYRPRSKFESLCAGEFLFEIGTLTCATVVGSLASQRYYIGGAPNVLAGHATLASTFTAGLILLLRALSRRRKALGVDELHALDGVLHTLHAVLIGNRPRSDLRICVFVPSNSNGHVHQITNYVGADPPSGKARELPASCGIVGKAFRTGANHYDRLPAHKSTVDYLVGSYGFSQEQAAATKGGRKAWAAIPIGEPGAVIAVIYLDSPSGDFFGNANSVKRKTLEAAVPGVAEFIARA